MLPYWGFVELEGGEEELVVRVVEETLSADLAGGITAEVGIQGETGSNQRVRINAGAVMEKYPVLVEDINLAQGFDVSIDMGWVHWPHDPVESNPLRGIRSTSRLIEIQGC